MEYTKHKTVENFNKPMQFKLGKEETTLVVIQRTQETIVRQITLIYIKSHTLRLDK